MLSRPGEGGLALARRNAELMDGVLHQLCLLADFERRGTTLLLGAVGGYGRRLLGLKSDLDLCFVTSGAPASVSSLIDDLLYPLWDAGVAVGHQVVALADVVASAHDDLPTATELLDLRLLAGSRSLQRALERRLHEELCAEHTIEQFIARLEERTEARHERFGDSVYLLEPDVKNGTGGLRDLDFAGWGARARFRTSELRELSRLGVLPLQRAEEVERALDFLWTVRNHLHQLAGRRSDRLTFPEQERVARAMGYAERVCCAPSASPLEHTGAMVEAFMSDYYRHARVIGHVSEQILGHAKRRRNRPAPKEEALGQGVIACEGGIGMADPLSLLADPALALRLYASAVGHDKPVLSRSRDLVAHALRDPQLCSRLRESREASHLFVQLVASSRRSPFRGRTILSELHDVGLLLAMIPEFAPVVGRVHHDIYHVYTVDVHSVAAVDRLHALRRGELATVHALGCRLAAEVSHPKMLALATLLHDVGKAIGGHDHAQRGAAMARPILARLGFFEDDIEDACHLIDKHLALYVVAARRDLSDPNTIADFAREVRGRDGLRDLYLLTIADLSTTSPSAMTKWKSGMIDALFRSTDALFTGRGTSAPSRVIRIRLQVRALWPEGADLAALDEFLESMPERYLLSNTPDDIVAHAWIATQRRESSVAATLVPSKLEDVMELCVVTEGRARTGLCVVAGDRPGLLASISAAISANGLRIQAAQVHSRPLASGAVQAVDLFWVHVPPEDALDLEARMRKLECDLNAVINGELAPRALFKPQRSSRFGLRSLPAVQTDVMIEHHASSQHTIIEVLAEDRPALLFLLAEALHRLELTIRIAKITTEGTRVIDVFYVTESDGSKIEPGPRTEQVREALRDTLSVARQSH